MNNSSQGDVHPIIAGRWSPRTFDADRPVETEKLMACLEVARWSSSCFGEEPWRFIVADRSHHPDSWQQMLACLVEGNRAWAQHAPVLILACAMPVFSRNGKVNRWAQYDTGQSMMSLSLQAVAEGLITHPMGGFDAGKAAEAYHIPADVTLMSVTALGYDADLKRAGTVDRQRKAMSEVALAAWEQPWQE